MKHWLRFINQKGDRVEITEEITNFKQFKKWESRVIAAKRSKTIAYIGDGKEDY
jgi:glutaredoxin-related protein